MIRRPLPKSKLANKKGSRRPPPIIVAPKTLERHSVMGRPRTYHPEVIPIVVDYIRHGLTDHELCRQIGIDQVTYYRWKNKYPDFCNAVTRTKAQVDELVEASMFKCAVGFEHPSVKIFMPADSDQPVAVPYMEYYPPVVRAQEVWLENRRPDRWKKLNDDAPPPVDPAAQAEHSRALTLAMALLEERARQGLPPLFYKPPPPHAQIEQAKPPVPIPGPTKPNGHGGNGSKGA